VYFSGFVPVFLGSTMLFDTEPFEQATVAGSPVTTVVDENVQLVAFVTLADSVTVPFDVVTEVGVAANPVTVGFGGFGVFAEAREGATAKAALPRAVAATSAIERVSQVRVDTPRPYESARRVLWTNMIPASSHRP
jgi:hypothetical protein